jgi:hypothetical protein
VSNETLTDQEGVGAEGGSETPADKHVLPRQRGRKFQPRGNVVLLPTPEAAPKHPQLSSLVSVRREMSKVYRLCKAGRIALEDGSRLTFMLSSILKAVELADIEPRLKALEQGRQPQLGRPSTYTERLALERQP